MAEDSFAEKEELLHRKHDLEWANFKARRELEAARQQKLYMAGEMLVGFGPDPFALEEASLRESQSRELLALVKEKIAASVVAEGKAPDVEPPKLPITRREFVQRILEEKGWSILDWANEASVSHVTAAAYLHGKTTTYRSTRMKLAKALGIPVAQLPK